MEGGAGVLESKKKRDHQVRTIRKKREELSSYKNEIKSTRPDDTSSILSSLLGWKSGEMSRGRRPPLEGRKFRFQLRERVSRVSLQKRASSSIRFVHDPLIATIGNCSSRVSSSRQIQNLSQHGQRRNSLGRMAPLLWPASIPPFHRLNALLLLDRSHSTIFESKGTEFFEYFLKSSKQTREFARYE